MQSLFLNVYVGLSESAVIFDLERPIVPVFSQQINKTEVPRKPFIVKFLSFTELVCQLMYKKTWQFIHCVKDFYRMIIKPQYELLILAPLEMLGCFALMLSVVAVP